MDNPTRKSRSARLAALLWVSVAALALVASKMAVSAPVPVVMGQEAAPTQTPQEILDEVRAEIVPAEGTSTEYGVVFSDAGYQQLLGWNETLKPLAAWASDYEGLDILLPCCEVAHPFRDESQNCGCGHHQAVYGLSKYLLGQGKSPAEVQSEIDRWRAYMFPREALMAELEQRALADPAMAPALDALVAQGAC